MARNGQRPRDHGIRWVVPVRRVTAAAWFGCGLPGGSGRACCCPTWVALDATTLTFLVHLPRWPATPGRPAPIDPDHVSLAAIVIGVITAELTPISSLSNYRDMTPFVVAAIALLFPQPAPRDIGGPSRGLMAHAHETGEALGLESAGVKTADDTTRRQGGHSPRSRESAVASATPHRASLARAPPL